MGKMKKQIQKGAIKRGEKQLKEQAKSERV